MAQKLHLKVTILTVLTSITIAQQCGTLDLDEKKYKTGENASITFIPRKRDTTHYMKVRIWTMTRDSDAQRVVVYNSSARNEARFSELNRSNNEGTFYTLEIKEVTYKDEGIYMLICKERIDSPNMYWTNTTSVFLNVTFSSTALNAIPSTTYHSTLPCTDPTNSNNTPLPIVIPIAALVVVVVFIVIVLIMLKKKRIQAQTGKETNTWTVEYAGPKGGHQRTDVSPITSSKMEQGIEFHKPVSQDGVVYSVAVPRSKRLEASDVQVQHSKMSPKAISHNRLQGNASLSKDEEKGGGLQNSSEYAVVTLKSHRPQQLPKQINDTENDNNGREADGAADVTKVNEDSNECKEKPTNAQGLVYVDLDFKVTHPTRKLQSNASETAYSEVDFTANSHKSGSVS